MHCEHFTSLHRSDYLCRESVNAAITNSFCRKCRIYALFCRECRDYALFRVEFYAEFLAEIFGNTQNFGRNSAEKIGRWSLWHEDRDKQKECSCVKMPSILRGGHKSPSLSTEFDSNRASASSSSTSSSMKSSSTSSSFASSSGFVEAWINPLSLQ